jgi:hypothetical protein
VSEAAFRIGLVPIHLLKSHERVIEERVVKLMREISSRGAQLRPILVDYKTLIILDGHHRVEALKRLGAKLVSAALVDYDSDCVKVSSWRPEWRVTKELVRRSGLTGNLLPPRTSRHQVCFEIPEVIAPLSILVG